MTSTMIDTGTIYRMANDHQAALREEAANLRAATLNDRRTGAPLPPTRGPLAALRRRLAGSPAFA